MRPLFFTSATLLFLELVLIRWIPAEVVYVGFFNNFVLIGSFLGIGLGILLGRGRPELARYAGAALVVLAIVVLFVRARGLPAPEQLFLGSGEQVQTNLGVLALAFILTVAVMAAFAIPLGPLLTSMPPLRAYATDIAGSLFGITAFVALAALGTGPVIWFAAIAILAALAQTRSPLSRHAVIVVAPVLAAAALSAAVDTGDTWSPYYRIDLVRLANGAEDLLVNGIPHQTMRAPTDPDLPPYMTLVYRSLPQRTFRNALIIGSGSGTDVAVALANRVERIDAVEIDPQILAIGGRDHPARPYANAAVREYVTDGRAFLRNSTSTYDLIVFAQTDSLTLVSSTANLRLESFLFTDEAFRSARDHLAPDGVFALYNFYRESWLVDRYATMLTDVFGRAPAVTRYPEFAHASAAALLAGPGSPAGSSAIAPVDDAAQQRVRDDWPFPYLASRGIPPQYLGALVGVVLLACLGVGGAAAATGLRPRELSLHFFVLGAAFLLLETRSLVTFSLLFGTTWLVNALVFAAILASVLAAIAVAARYRPRRNALYAILFASLALNYLVPAQSLLFDPAWLRYTAAAFLAFTPVFAANIVFARAFADTRTADVAFASNLLGAVVGGILEWSALAIGYQALLVPVAGLYLVAAATGVTRPSTAASPRMASNESR